MFFSGDFVAKLPLLIARVELVLGTLGLLSGLGLGGRQWNWDLLVLFFTTFDFENSPLWECSVHEV